MNKAERKLTNPSVRKSVEHPTSLNVMDLKNDISIASARGGRHNILVEGKGNEENKR
jgi:hypothetical protein